MAKLAERLRPFSHIPGATCLIPGTLWELEAFPTLLRFGRRIEHKLDITGPVEGFTLQLDLERDCVFVFGQAKEGYFRLRITASDSGFIIAGKKETIKIPAEVEYVFRPNVERLFLGSHKAQDWDLVQRRSCLKEILPILFCLGQKIPFIAPQPLRGTARLLAIPQDRNQSSKAICSFLQAAFTKILIPRLIDDQHQGLAPEEEVTGNRFYLIQEGAKMIRSLFFRQDERRVMILPALPVSLDAGRMQGLQVPGIGEIDFEWSKKIVRNITIRAAVSGDIVLDLQKGITSFRMRHNRKEKGEQRGATEPVVLQQHKTYLLDRFNK